LHYVAGHVREGAIGGLPEGYKVSENEKTWLPLLKKA
jgi:hypothetical protein